MLKRVVTRRLPGFRFEADSPPLAEVLPRMDVACFVGFAASGPLNVPVAVESITQFNAIFGTDAPLAWDARLGATTYAYLAPAVRAFFANGGRRCWIVRVARVRKARAPEAAQAEAGRDPLNFARENFFPVPGMARILVGEDGEIKEATPAFARARSEGSWSDALEVSAALLTRPAQVKSFALAESPPQDTFTLELAVDAPGDLAEGDLLRLTFDGGIVLLLLVAKVASAPAAAPGERRRTFVEGKRPVWLQTDPPGANAFDNQTGLDVQATLYTHEPQSSPPATADARDGANAFASTYPAKLRLIEREDEFGSPPATRDVLSATPRGVEFEVVLPLADAPAPGSVLYVEGGGWRLLVTVQELGVASQPQGNADALLRLSGLAYWLLDAAPALPADALPAGERLSFELRVRKENEYTLSVSDLSFGADGARFWGKLPTDDQVYLRDESAPVNEPVEELWQPLGEQRFPLASTGERDALFFPLVMPPLADQSLGAVRLQGGALERDGLAEFDAALFLDPELVESTTEGLIPLADFIRYFADKPRRLTGVHAALSVEEVTIIAAPDAVHRGWAETEVGQPRAPVPSLPIARPEQCGAPDDDFLACDLVVIESPRLTASEPLSNSGTFTLAWQTASPDGEFRQRTTFILEASGAPDFASAAAIYRGAETTHTLYARNPGDYYYRVRAEVEIKCDEQDESGKNESAGQDDQAESKCARVETSDWSNGVVVRVETTNRWQLNDEKAYDSSDLLALHRALLRLSAARADLLVVLAMPEHYREDKSLEHAATLKLTTSRGAKSSRHVPALNDGETGALSYGALYHPWLTGRDQFDIEKFRSAPPDGAACGVLARRALSRGAWIAPANELFSGVIALTPNVARTRWLDLQLAQINLIRQEPRGFIALNADTLSLDEDLREISVRRLLILLRRLCLRHGATYVFEPNSPAFRRLVQRGFEAVLDGMFARGAFAGKTAATSYRVVTGEELNTPQSVEAGRFIVEIRVAPSQPLTFMTIRLVQTGDRGFVTEVRANG
jgi:hypothetical protein